MRASGVSLGKRRLKMPLISSISKYTSLRLFPAFLSIKKALVTEIEAKKPLIIPRPIIQELLDMELFKTVKIKFDTLSWDNGVDFAPEYLYDQMIIQKKVA